MEEWTTDADLAAAYERLAVGVPGFVYPAAFTVARVDRGTLTFGHVNPPGSQARLSAVALATVAGYTHATAVLELSAEQLHLVVKLLAPAEAATHVPHPNLWSWRQLLDDEGPESGFLAFFVANLSDEPVNRFDEQFRRRLS